MHPTGDRNAIVRRIDRIISQFEEANEENESEYSVEVNQILNFPFELIEELKEEYL